jgi:pimeloyl-ACP methyl ester carboxylesterase
MSHFLHQISYTEVGHGNPIVLLHGFPMSGEIWENDFLEGLSSEFTVITVDLPGFGKSPLPDEQITIHGIASHLTDWLKLKGLKKSLIIGHSLGGYITLAMIARSPEKFAGFGLLHSTALPDSDEKKQSRSKTIEFIEKNGTLAFTTNFIPPLFADKKHPGIEKVKKIGGRTAAASVIGYTQAMRDRPDRREVLRTFHDPILFIAGAQDAGIPADSIRQQASLCQSPTLHILDNQAHMAMLETPVKTSALIGEFGRLCFENSR